jgi:UDP-N-acetylmuramoyl-L-alanyl-D-glutamate--2,6-diaminopimelate ligase
MTCLHPEHIESHGSFEAYRAAKTAFFKDVARNSKKPNKLFFVNAEAGVNAKYFEEAVMHPTGKGNFGTTIFYTREDFIGNVLGGDVEQIGDWLSSQFNLENAAAVQAIAAKQGMSNQSIIKALAQFKGVAGRQEFITGFSRTVVVDSALTPESLEAICVFLKHRLVEAKKGGKLIAVFGSAGGGRDTWKRPTLGGVAEKYCDHIFLTTDDSYDESPENIIADIAKGIKDSKKYTAITDRRAAIRAAIASAGPHDIVALTGMGSQSYTYGPKGVRTPWNERAIAEELLRELDK